MAQNPLLKLRECGQSVWNDNISRRWLKQGGLVRLIEQDGLGGVTSNPTIFDKAIGGSEDYDDELRRHALERDDAETIFKRLAITDITMAADQLRPVYDRESGADGFVSIEVSPAAAHDTEKTLEDARFFWSTIDRPNIMVKVPATPEGIPAIEQLLFEGININITLIFAIEVYEQVLEAYLRGLERRVGRRQSIDRIASVASFFVSRVDTLVDKLLDQKLEAAESATRQELEDLCGKAAVANAKIAYERFQSVCASERFGALKAQGARPQRPLWASTSTKNPKYPDTLYVDTLVGPDTVNTMPPQTIEAVRDHGHIECGTVMKDVAEAHRLIERLQAKGIRMTDVTDQLTREGVKSFQDSQNELFDTIREKAERMVAESKGEPSAVG